MEITGIMAKRGGFEPPKPFGLHTFQACAFDHSATSPQIKWGRINHLKSKIKDKVQLFKLLPNLKTKSGKNKILSLFWQAKTGTRKNWHAKKKGVYR